MADRRMFSKQIIESDAFLSLRLSTQALYFHLCLSADDEGFINNPKRIAKNIGAKQSDINSLIEKRFVLSFDSGVIVIKHWRINNHMRKDRYNQTKCQDERDQIYIKENDSYTFDAEQSATKCQPNGNQVTTKCQPTPDKMTTKCQPNVNQLATTCHPSISLVQVSTEQVSTSTGYYEPSLDSQNSVDYFEDVFRRPISQPELKSLSEWQKIFPADVINFAVDQAVLNDKRSWKYVEAILRNWQSSGCKSKQDAERQAVNFEKSKSTNSHKRVDVLPDYIVHPVPIDDTPASDEQIAETKAMLEQMRKESK